MKINIKNIGLILIITLIFSLIIFKHYNAKETEYEELYILQIGAYKNYDNVIKNTLELENYIIYQEKDLYKIFIGITMDDEIFDKLKTIYADNITTFKKVIKTNDEKFIRNIKDYDELIKNTNDSKSLNLIIKEELKELNKLLNKNNK